jgi:hypothetical protein
MDIPEVAFFIFASVWLVLALKYSCVLVMFLRLRSRGQLDAIYDEDFGRIHLPWTNHRLYLPLGCFFRSCLHRLHQEHRRQPASSSSGTAHYMTTEERRRAMELLLWEERQNEKTVHCKECKVAPVAEAALAPESSQDSTADTDTGTAELDSDLEGPMCGICLDEFSTEPDATVLHSPTCPHDFHKDCIMDWLQRHGTRECPCCRVAMITEDEVWEAVKRLRKEPRKQSRRETKCFLLFRRESCTEEDESESEENNSSNSSTHYSETSVDDDVIMVNPTLSSDSASSAEEGDANTLADANV